MKYIILFACTVQILATQARQFETGELIMDSPVRYKASHFRFSPNVQFQKTTEETDSTDSTQREVSQLNTLREAFKSFGTEYKSQYTLATEFEHKAQTSVSACSTGGVPHGSASASDSTSMSQKFSTASQLETEFKKGLNQEQKDAFEKCLQSKRATQRRTITTATSANWFLRFALVLENVSTNEYSYAYQKGSGQPFMVRILIDKQMPFEVRIKKDVKVGSRRSVHLQIEEQIQDEKIKDKLLEIYQLPEANFDDRLTVEIDSGSVPLLSATGDCAINYPRGARAEIEFDDKVVGELKSYFPISIRALSNNKKAVSFREGLDATMRYLERFPDFPERFFEFANDCLVSVNGIPLGRIHDGYVIYANKDGKILCEVSKDELSASISRGSSVSKIGFLRVAVSNVVNEPEKCPLELVRACYEQLRAERDFEGSLRLACFLCDRDRVEEAEVYGCLTNALCGRINIRCEDMRGSNPVSLLWVAVTFKDHSVLKQLLSDVGYRSELKKNVHVRNLLRHAIEVDDVTAYGYLYSMGARMPEGLKPLCEACCVGSTNIINYIVAQNKKSILEKDNQGKSPLGCSAGNIKLSFNVCNMLLDNGAKVDELDESGKTPLMVAAMNGDKEKCLGFLMRGADPRTMGSQENENGQKQDAEYLARVNGHADIADLLKAEKMIKDKWLLKGEWRLHDPDYSEKEIIECVRSGVSPNRDIGGGFTLYTLALAKSCDSIFEELLHRGAVVNRGIPRCKYTILMRCAEVGNLELTKKLIDVMKADVCAKTADGKSAFCYAIDNRHYDVAEYLFDKGGADSKSLLSCDEVDCNAYGYAVIKVRDEKGAPLLGAMFRKAESHNVDENGMTPLMFASKTGNILAVRTIREAFGCAPALWREYLSKTCDVGRVFRDEKSAIDMAGSQEIKTLLQEDLTKQTRE